jgi:hypothetical protein
MLYRLYDKKENLSEEDLRLKKQGAQPIENESDAKIWNDKGFGIFRPVNIFKSMVRTQENLDRIKAWFVDIDMSKSEAFRRVFKSPLSPSKVIETKNGIQLHFYASDATVKNYRMIEERLISFFGGDKNAKDLCRISREPGYYHMKDPNDPFLVQVLKEYDLTYSEEEMMRHFNVSSELEGLINPSDRRINYISYIKESDTKKKNMYNNTTTATLTSNSIYNYNISTPFSSLSYKEIYHNISIQNQGNLLLKLSNIPELNSEEITLHPHKTGVQIHVNKKSTSCWIDLDGKIGSSQGGGPTIIQWIDWYFKRDGRNPYSEQCRKEKFDIIKKYIWGENVANK